MELFSEYGTILIILAASFGFFMAWGVGANDVANAMGTSVGSKALTIKQAILIGANGIITNKPKVVYDVLKNLGMR